MFTRLSTSSIAQRQVKVNSALAGNSNGARGGFGGVYNQYFTFATLGNAIAFGTVYQTRKDCTGASSATRALSAGGINTFTDALVSSIEYCTIPTLGVSANFGDLTVGRYLLTSCANSTRAVFACGSNVSNVKQSTIDYVTTATTGNATSFGSYRFINTYFSNGCASPTRGIFHDGFDGNLRTEIEYITIATTGNATNFGYETAGRYSCGSYSSDTRGVILNGANATTTMDYITIASTGNATSFGSAVYARNGGTTGTSSNIRGVAMGADSTNSTKMSYVTIATTGNSVYFGELAGNTSPSSNGGLAPMSSGHGGLQ